MSEPQEPVENGAGGGEDDAGAENRVVLRERWQGSADELGEALFPFFNKFNSLKYGETEKAPIEEKTIIAKREVVQALEKLQSNLAFPKATMIAVEGRPPRPARPACCHKLDTDPGKPM